MTKETERKYWLPFGLNEEVEKGKGKKIRQNYLDYKKNERLKQEIESILEQEVNFEGIKEARVRQKGEGEKAQYYLTLKSDGTLERDEIEKEINKSEFIELWNSSSLGTVEKTRYEIPFEEGITAEYDEYEGKLEGLATAEFEYNPDEIMSEDIFRCALDLYGEDEVCQDVTEYKCFKNKNLATAKSLDEFFERCRAEMDEIIDQKIAESDEQINNMTKEEILRESRSIENQLTSW